jgi:hypothetical protein
VIKVPHMEFLPTHPDLERKNIKAEQAGNQVL